MGCVALDAFPGETMLCLPLKVCLFLKAYSSNVLSLCEAGVMKPSTRAVIRHDISEAVVDEVNCFENY